MQNKSKKLIPCANAQGIKRKKKNMITETDFNLVRKLNDYEPENSLFTSETEVKQIENTLQIRERDLLSLRNLRNCVVMNHTIRRLNKDNPSIKGLMSITTVIDAHILKLGG